MSKKSVKTYIYSNLTFGLYDLVWFARVRQELIAKTGVRIPSMAWLVLLTLVRISTFVVACVAIWTAVFASLSLSFFVIVACCFVVLNLCQRAYVWWLKNFIVAIEKATDGKLNQSVAMGLLLTSPDVGMAVVEQALNDPDSLPKQLATFDPHQFAIPASIENNKLLKRILTVIAVLLAVFLVFLLAIPFLIQHL